MSKKELEQYKDKIITLYVNGMMQKDIANMFNTSKSSIGRFLRSYNVFGRTKLTLDDKEDIVSLYKSGNTMDEIALKYGISNKTVSEILHLSGAHISRYGEHSKKYTLDEHYFDIIDNPDKAYILGLLYADGCNTGKSISISLKSEDKYILEKINKLIGSNRQLKLIPYHQKNERWSDQYSLCITNKYMATQLMNLGVVPHKSLILTFPDWLSEDLYPDFIRGYMDGDGNIAKKEKRINLIGTETFCSKLADILHEVLNINCGIYLCHGNKNTTTRTLQIAGGNQVKRFLDYIYNDANLYLFRKYDIYKDLYC